MTDINEEVQDEVIVDESTDSDIEVVIEDSLESKPQEEPAEEELTEQVEEEPVEDFTGKPTKLVNGKRMLLTEEELLSLNPVKTLEELKADKLAELKAIFSEKSQRPVIQTSLGFEVQAGYQDLANFNVGLELGSTAIRAHDNKSYTVTDEEFSQVLFEIKANGARMMNVKWAFEDAIKLAESEPELNEINLNNRW